MPQHSLDHNLMRDILVGTVVVECYNLWDIYAHSRM